MLDVGELAASRLVDVVYPLPKALRYGVWLPDGLRPSVRRDGSRNHGASAVRGVGLRVQPLGNCSYERLCGSVVFGNEIVLEVKG
jgi:hypothetical protein